LGPGEEKLGPGEEKLDPMGKRTSRRGKIGSHGEKNVPGKKNRSHGKRTSWEKKLGPMGKERPGRKIWVQNPDQEIFVSSRPSFLFSRMRFDRIGPSVLSTVQWKWQIPYLHYFHESFGTGIRTWIVDDARIELRVLFWINVPIFISGIDVGTFVGRSCPDKVAVSEMET
jgi:hypothetical protein